MLISQALARNLKIKHANLRKIRKILDIVVGKITDSGGCFIDGLGVAYLNKKNGTRDPIGHLLSVSDLKGFGTIDSEAQRPLVRKIATKYGLDISRDSERGKFVQFLQALQDAHDEVFDKFTNNEPEENLIPLFRGKCNQIAFEYRV
jgi:hypothetical protein